MSGRSLILLAGLLGVGLVCCSCNSDSGTSAGTATAKVPDKSAMKQQGAGGVKAAGGGGVAGYPEDAKPGEKVGAPPSGGKAGGG